MAEQQIVHQDPEKQKRSKKKIAALIGTVAAATSFGISALVHAGGSNADPHQASRAANPVATAKPGRPTPNATKAAVAAPSQTPNTAPNLCAVPAIDIAVRKALGSAANIQCDNIGGHPNANPIEGHWYVPTKAPQGPVKDVYVSLLPDGYGGADTQETLYQKYGSEKLPGYPKEEEIWDSDDNAMQVWEDGEVQGMPEAEQKVEVGNLDHAHKKAQEIAVAVHSALRSQ